LAALLLPGCFAYSNRGSDIDRTPVVDTGVGARIIYPGQTAAMPVPGQAASGQAPSGQTRSGQAQSGQTSPEAGASDTVTPGSGSITFIGGAAVDEKKSVRIREEPLFHKYLMLPLAIAAAPFAAAAEAIRGDEEPGPEIPARPHQQAPPAPPPQGPSPSALDYEQAELQAMERELAQRGELAQTSAPAPGGPSIADELAALQRQPAPETAPAVASAPVRPAREDPTLVTADGIVDRDGDGRVDQWIFRQDGEIVRTLFDQDGDGHPDRTLVYDPQSHRIAHVEEDSDLDGAVDSWTDYRDGQIIRRRADANQDGQVDSWSYYKGDEIARHESDTSGDGFRDRVRFYRNGVVSREEQDNDGDGQAELTLHFDAASQVVRRDEDTDGDGKVDVISYYEGGRLVRRELLGGAPEGP
jgi:hypothetical protein